MPRMDTDPENSDKNNSMQKEIWDKIKRSPKFLVP